MMSFNLLLWLLMIVVLRPFLRLIITNYTCGRYQVGMGGNKDVDSDGDKEGKDGDADDKSGDEDDEE
jgi:hypothetical protein